MKGQNVGYIRVSSVDQNTARQLDGVELDTTFEDRCSGKDTNRTQLKACLRHLRKGDCLNVHSIDRLARSLKDLQGLVEDLTEKGISIQFHKENLTFSGDSNPMHKLMFQMDCGFFFKVVAQVLPNKVSAIKMRRVGIHEFVVGSPGLCILEFIDNFL